MDIPGCLDAWMLSKSMWMPNPRSEWWCLLETLLQIDRWMPLQWVTTWVSWIYLDTWMLQQKPMDAKYPTKWFCLLDPRSCRQAGECHFGESPAPEPAAALVNVIPPSATGLSQGEASLDQSWMSQENSSLCQSHFRECLARKNAEFSKKYFLHLFLGHSTNPVRQSLYSSLQLGSSSSIKIKQTFPSHISL